MAEQSFHLLAEEIKSTRTVIMEAYKSQNFRMLKAIAHKMKGAFGYCGLPHLETTLRSIETATKNK